MTFERKSLGRLGEDLAASFLKKQGYKTIERNFRTRFGELDIICQKNKMIIFIEVRSKASNFYGRGEESITPAKKRRLSLMAKTYLIANKQLHKIFRIDGIFIDFKKDGSYNLRHLENMIEDVS